MKELRFNGNFMGFEGSECVEVHTDYDAPLTDCQSCVEPCAVDHPCHGCFAAWRAENDRLHKALVRIRGFEHGAAYPRCDECALPTPEHEPWCAVGIAREALEEKE